MDVDNINFSKGKRLGKIACIISGIFTFLGLTIAQFNKTVLNSESYVQDLKDSFINSGTSANDVEIFIDFLSSFFAVLLIVMFIYLVLEILTLVALFRLKENSTKKTSYFLIVNGILHLLGLRLLAGILFLLSGLKLVKHSKEFNLAFDKDKTD